MNLKKLFILFVIITVTSALQAQIIKTKLDAVAGISAREFVHMGIRYQYTDFTQLGIYYGGDLGFNDAIITTYSVDNSVHFGKHSYYSNRAVWYGRLGFTYAVQNETAQYKKYSYVNLGIGREFTVNDWLGFNADMGLIWQLREKTEDKGPNPDIDYYTRWEWHPLARIQMFISF